MLDSLLSIHPFVRATRNLWIARIQWLWTTPARHNALIVGIPLHSWPGAEKCGQTEPNQAPFVALCGETRARGAAGGRARFYEVQARHRRAYSPSAATKS
jgi:hypothetical protein